MKVMIELSTGKKIELTMDELKELFGADIKYNPGKTTIIMQPVWPFYYTPNPFYPIEVKYDSTAANTGPSFSIGDKMYFTNDDGTVD